ncbi:hypothetical protein ACFIJ5_13365 [Haloimpatiens sp. FM7330]|uniref:hypothetical protein n=1 Tax=Haloimpatiens sp. FM7330 TaxID=3298610 RepID=UPI003629C78F
MRFNKKCILSILIGITVIISGCSNLSSNKVNTNSSDKKNNGLANNLKSNSDKEFNKYYDNFIAKNEGEINKILEKARAKEAKKIFQKQKDKFLNNISIMKELNKKAMNSCSKGYYVFTKINNPLKKDAKTEVKEYFSNGNYRSEEYKNGKLTYFTVYSKEKDTNNFYDRIKNKTQKTTKFSKKNNGYGYYPFGYFTLYNNALGGDMKYINYKGKKVLYSENTFENFTRDNKPSKSISKYWYDAETGIIMKEEQKCFIDGKLDSDYSANYTIEFNKSYDKDMFIFDKNKLNK